MCGNSAAIRCSSAANFLQNVLLKNTTCKDMLKRWANTFGDQI